MSRIAFATISQDTIEFGGSTSPTVLLIDSVFETISIRRVTVHKNSVIRLWQRMKSLRELQQANPAAAVYWCSLDKTTAFICVSNLSLASNVVAENELDSYIARSKCLKLMCSQLMSIGRGLSSQCRQALLLLNSADGVRHVYFVDHKPVFIRLLPPNDSPTGFVEPLQATQQHLDNRSMLCGDAAIICNGVSDAELLSIKQNCAASSIDRLDVDTVSLSSLATKFYLVKRMRWFLIAQLPAYWSDGLYRYRYRNASLLTTSVLCLLASILIIGLAGFNIKSWVTLLHTRVSIVETTKNTQALKAEAAAFSSAPKATAERLQRLDLLRSLQPAGADVLLSTVSTAFEAHPLVSLNHISWFTVSADEGLQSQTQVAHRDHLSMTAVNSDSLSILITGSIEATSLSEQQAVFDEFKTTLMSLQGIGNIIEERTPVTQWRMPDSTALQQRELNTESFTLRFSLNNVSS